MTQLCKIPFEVEPLEEHAVTLDKTISLLRKMEYCFQFEDNKKTQLKKLLSLLMIFDRAGTIYCLQLPLPQQLSPTWAQTDKQIFLHPRGHHTIYFLKHLRNFVHSVSPGTKLLKYWVCRGGLY